MFIPSHISFTATHSPSISHVSLLSRSRSNETVCGFEGNDDIYGIGIRIGIYSQTLAVWFANYFLFSEVQNLRDSVSIFGLAVLVVALIFAMHPEDVYAAEAFIVLQILAWSCLMAVHAKSSYAAVVWRRRTVVRKIANDCVNMCMVALHIWFWWKGLDQMKKTPCGTWMMYIIKTDMYGWARSIMKAISVFVGVMTVYWVGIEYAKLYFLVGMSKIREELAEALQAWENKQVKKKEDSFSSIGPETGDADTNQACSQFSCETCSPVEQEHRLDRQATLVSPSDISRRSSSLLSHPTPRETPNGSPSLHPTSPKAPDHDIPFSPLPVSGDTVLHQVYESELFITHCTTASPFKISENGKPLPPFTTIRSILSQTKQRSPTSNQSGKTSPTWLQCQYRLFKSVFMFRFPARSFSIYTHLQQTHLLDPLNGPFQVLASFTYSPSAPNKTPTWQTTALASSLLLTSPSNPKKVWLAWYYALVDIVVHVMVILHLELTLAWNHVGGLSELWTSVGQLLPFIIGISGLTLVLGRWIGRRWEKRYKEKGSGKRVGRLLKVEVEEENLFRLSEEVRESYGRWKADFEASISKLEVARTHVST